MKKPKNVLNKLNTEQLIGAEFVLRWLHTSPRFHKPQLALLTELHGDVAALLKKRTEPPESEYWKAIRTGKKPAIWPPITMTQEELDHFRSAAKGANHAD